MQLPMQPSPDHGADFLSPNIRPKPTAGPAHPDILSFSVLAILSIAPSALVVVGGTSPLAPDAPGGQGLAIALLQTSTSRPAGRPTYALLPGAAPAARKGLSRRGKAAVVTCQIPIRGRACDASKYAAGCGPRLPIYAPAPSRKTGRLETSREPAPRSSMPPEHLQAEAEEEGRRRDGSSDGIGRPSHGPAKGTSGFVSPDPADDDLIS